MLLNRLLLCFFALTTADYAFADNLPVGVGAIGIGGRQYVGEPVYYDQSGSASTLGERFNSKFDAACMSSGKCGTDLKKLYENIKKYDTSNAGAEQSLADQLSLGSQHGRVKTDLSIKVVGMAFGITDKITVFAAVPIINASLDADIDVVGDNNAAMIKEKLGDAAFDDLKSGLDQASRLSKAAILAKITDEYRYGSINHWEYNGIGDIAVGARTGWSFKQNALPKYALALSSQINFPTGPQYNPDSLTQMDLSRGYKSLDLSSDHRLTWRRAAIGSEIGGGFGIPQETVRRVPEGDEQLVAADRKSSVHVQPGMDTKLALYGILGNSTFRGQYRLGSDAHHADTFSGPIAGNYRGLDEKTASKVFYHEAAFTVTTVRAYKEKKSMLPYILTLTARNSLAGANTTAGPSFDLSFMTFFSTPMQRNATMAKHKNG